jgi:Flp pilus assembly protein TadG
MVTMTFTFARRLRGSVRRLGGESGTAIIEAALTLPLLLLVAVAIFEFGRAFQTWEVLTNAAREGARVAVLPDSTTAGTEARARAYLDSGALLGSSATITVTATTIPIGAGTATAKLVRVDYPFQFMVLQPVASLVVHGSTTGAPITMSASAEMRNESPF